MKRFFGLLFGQNYTVKRATTLLAITALLSNILGLLRNVVFYRFVDPAKLDIYYASFRIPDLIFNILILGAISSAFIPVLSELISKDNKEKVWDVSHQVISWLTVTFGLIALVLFITMPLLMRVVVPGFDPTRFTETIFISRILLLQSIFFAWSWTFGGILNSFHRFATFAIAPLLYNISIIVGGLLAHRYGISVMAYGVVLGAILHMSIQYTEVRKIGYTPKLDLRWTPEVKEILRLMVPRSISQGMVQIVLIVFTTLASGLTAGSIAIFSGMNDLQSTPLQVVGNSLATAFFPTLTLYASQESWDKVSSLLNKVIRSSLFILLPTCSLGYILRAQVVRLYFGIGGASWTLTNLAIDTFVWFLLGIVPATLVVLLARVFYSFKDTRTPLILNIISSSFGIAIAIVGIQYYQGEVPVLALATSAAAILQCILYLIALQTSRHISFSWNILIPKACSYALGALFMAGIGWLALQGVNHIYTINHFLSTRLVPGLFIQMILAGAAAVTSYYLYSIVMHREELAWLKKKTFTKPQ